MAGISGFRSLAPKTKNAIVAGGLSAFVFGVYFYTMRAVGGTDELQVAINKFEEEKVQKEAEANVASKDSGRNKLQLWKSNMPDQSGGCCRCCFSFIFTLGLTALFVWLSLRTSNPKCTIRSFYLPALNRTLNDTKNTTVFVTLRLGNTNKDKGVYYDAVNLTFRLQPNATGIPVATYAVPQFYQGHKKTATKKVVVGPQGLNWTAVSSGVYPNGSAIFRVDLATEVRFKIMFWRTKRHRLNVGADVLVNDSGGKVNRKDIKLSAAPDHHLIGFFSGQVGVLSNFLVLIFLIFL
ncbi:hypothetical protein COP2_007736 [Malus domestica]